MDLSDALLVVLALLAFAGVIALVRLVGRRERELERVRGSRHREAEKRLQAETELAEFRERQAELERSPLLGRTVIANTPRPDDRAIRGVVARELDDGGLLLQGAVYLDPAGDPSNPGIREVPAGELVVPRISFAQIIYPSE